MSPDFRYHIASLAAVFLALGVGILVGTAFVGAPVVSRQTRLIGNLEDNVKGLRRETAERQQTEEALRELFPGIVRGKLAGKRVLVVQTGAYADAAGEAAEALRAAGATSVMQIALPAEGWERRTNGDNAALSTESPTDDEIAMTARRLAPLLSGASNDALTPFRERGQVTGEASLAGTTHYIVLVGGETVAGAAAAVEAMTPPTPAPAKGKKNPPAPPLTVDENAGTRLARTRDAALIQAWQAHGVTVVGTEPFSADISYMRTYQSAGIATVDSIDRALGKIALPFALMGEKGNYGMKPTSDRVLPATLDQSGGGASASAGAVPLAATPAP